MEMVNHTAFTYPENKLEIETQQETYEHFNKYISYVRTSNQCGRR